MKNSLNRYEFMGERVRNVPSAIGQFSIRLLALLTPLMASPALADVGLIKAGGLGTVVNGSASAGCTSGLCSITGGTPGGDNLFHRFSYFDTRGKITGVDVDTQGLSNVIFGVTNPLGSFFTRPISFSGPANVFVLSPGGVSVGGAAAFTNVQHLALSSATGLRFDSGALFDVFNSKADDLRAITGTPLKGRHSLETDLASLKDELDLDANGDVVIDGGLLTVDQGLLIDSQEGNVVLLDKNSIGFDVAESGKGLITGASVRNEGNLTIESGILTVDGPGIDSGMYDVASDAKLVFTAPAGKGRTLAAGSNIHGTGDLRVEGGFLEVNGDFGIAETGRVSVVGGKGLTLNTPQPVVFKRPFILSGDGVTLSGTADITTVGEFKWSGGADIDGKGFLYTNGPTLISDGDVQGLNRVWYNNGKVDFKDGSGVEFLGITAWVNEREGTISLDQARQIPIDSSVSEGSLLPLFVNQGTVSSQSGVPQSIAHQLTFSNEGKLFLSSGELRVDSLFFNSGTIELGDDAILSVPRGFRNLGTIEGSGTVNVGQADLINQEVISPGGKNRIGRLEVHGNLVQAPTGSLVLELGGSGSTEADLVAITGFTQLAGELRSSLLNNYRPIPGDSTEQNVITSKGGFAENDTFDSLVLPENVEFSTFQLSSGGAAAVLSTICPDSCWTGKSVDNASNWFDATNWNDNVLPGRDNDVLLGRAVPADIAFGGDSTPVVAIQSLTSRAGNDLKLLAGTLLLTEQTSASGLDGRLFVRGGTLQGEGGSLEVRGGYQQAEGQLGGFDSIAINQAQGPLAISNATLTTRPGGEIAIRAESGEITISSSTLNSGGIGNGSGGQIQLDGSSISLTESRISASGSTGGGRIGVRAESGPLTITSSSFVADESLSLDSKGSQLLLQGTNSIGFSRSTTGAGVLAGDSVNNEGFLKIESGKILVDGQGMDSGVYDVASQAALSFTAPDGDRRILNSEADIQGDGELNVKGGILDVNGKFSISRSGQVNVIGGNGLILNTLEPVVFKKPFTLSGDDVALSGEALIKMNSDFNWSGGANLAGSGALYTNAKSLIDGGKRQGINRDWFNNGEVQFINGSSVEFQGAKTWTNTASGLISLDDASPLPISVSSGLPTGPAALPRVVNLGSISKTSGSTQTIASDLDFSNVGSLLLSSGELVVDGLFSNSGTTRLGKNAALSVPAGFTNDGLIEGQGQINVAQASLINRGTVSPGGENPIGTLSIVGDFVQSDSGTLITELAGPSDADLLVVKGSAELGGELRSALLNGYSPIPGDSNQQDVINASDSINREFDVINVTQYLEFFTERSSSGSGYAGVLASVCPNSCWTGKSMGNDSDWFDPDNWNDRVLPGRDDHVLLGRAVPAEIVFGIKGASEAAVQSISSRAGNDLKLQGGTLLLTQQSTSDLLDGNLVVKGGSLTGEGGTLNARGGFQQGGGELSGFDSILIRQPKGSLGISNATLTTRPGGGIAIRAESGEVAIASSNLTSGGNSRGGQIDIAAQSGDLLIDGATLDASSNGVGGRIGLDGRNIMIADSDFFTSGSEDGGLIRVGFDPETLQGGLFPETVLITEDSQLVADAPSAKGGIIAINGRDIAVRSSTLNILGNTGGLLRAGSLQTDRLVLDADSTIVLGPGGEQRFTVRDPGGVLINDAQISRPLEPPSGPPVNPPPGPPGNPRQDSEKVSRQTINSAEVAPPEREPLFVLPSVLDQKLFLDDAFTIALRLGWDPLLIGAAGLSVEDGSFSVVGVGLDASGIGTGDRRLVALRSIEETRDSFISNEAEALRDTAAMLGLEREAATAGALSPEELQALMAEVTASMRAGDPRFTPAVLRMNVETSPDSPDISLVDLTLIPLEGDLIGRRVKTPAQDLLLLLRELYRQMARQEPLNLQDPSSAARQLHAILISPIAAELQRRQVTSLLISADSGLQAVPYAALHDGEQFLGERYALSLTPSLGLTPLKAPSQGDAGRQLAAGASRFDGLAPLPLVPQELERLDPAGEADRFLDRAFTPSTLLEQASQPSIRRVHVATHAEFLPGGPERARLHTGTGPLALREFASLRERREGVPLDLFTLSACRTALGDADSELGFSGLALQAGARSAIGTLWYVDDVSTSAFFVQFYRLLDQGLSKGQALRVTRSAMIRGEIRGVGDRVVGIEGQVLLDGLTPAQQRRIAGGLSHPYYWSGISLLGTPW